MSRQSSGIGVPLRLRPTFDPKPWGGRRLEAFGKLLPEGAIGESLESGPGSTVVGGRFDAATLADVTELYPLALLGERGVVASGALGGFPLLIKLIDAREDLSVQVHPGDGNAPSGKRGKTEAWLILATEPGASLITGVTGEIDPRRIGDQVIREEVAPGDVFLVPAGTVHAIGGGVLLYEIQQASDVTYRLYDWGRPREMHLDAGLAVADRTRRATRITSLPLDEHHAMLVACRYFALERWMIAGERDVAGDGQSCRILTVIDGEVSIDTQTVARGESVLLPADLETACLRPSGNNATLLVGFIPDLETDVIAPLEAAGHPRSAIEQLGVSIP